ncbi:MAG: phage baseplate plug family protein [Thiobacillus sp.]
MQIIPLQSVPNQSLSVTLNGQLCAIELRSLGFQNSPEFILGLSVLGDTLGSLYQLPATMLFITLTVAGAAIITNQICLDRKLLVREPYLGFLGDIGFIDNQGTDDPDYMGLGNRFQLIYFAPADL